MKFITDLWRSLSNLLADIADFLGSTIDFCSQSIKSHAQSKFRRFILGSLLGAIVALIYWSYDIYFHVSIPISQGIIGSLILVISFGIAIGSCSEIGKILIQYDPTVKPRDIS